MAVSDGLESRNGVDRCDDSKVDISASSRFADNAVLKGINRPRNGASPGGTSDYEEKEEVRVLTTVNGAAVWARTICRPPRLSTRDMCGHGQRSVISRPSRWLCSRSCENMN